MTFTLINCSTYSFNYLNSISFFLFFPQTRWNIFKHIHSKTLRCILTKKKCRIQTKVSTHDGISRHSNFCLIKCSTLQVQSIKLTETAVGLH